MMLLAKNKGETSVKRMCAAGLVFALAILTVSAPAIAAPTQGGEIPSFSAADIRGKIVALDEILTKNPDLVIVYFFTVNSGQRLAQRLRALDLMYTDDKLSIVAFGLKEEEEALKKFADDLQLKYAVIKDTEKLAAEQQFGPFRALPVTMIVAPKKNILRILTGGGGVEVDILNSVADCYFTKDNTDAAIAIADLAAKEGENATASKEIKGYSLAAAGKLDEAEAEFTAIGDKTGIAKVALEKGEFDKAVEIAAQAPAGDGYADTVKATALLRSGKIAEAEVAFTSAASKEANEWQKSEAITGQSRILQENKNYDGAVTGYQQAQVLDPFNVEALSNEGAAHRETGNLEKASQVLTTAQERGINDPLIGMMLQQITRQLQQANNIERSKLINQQIADLSKRFKELKAEGKDKPVDPWTSRPMIVAFLPSENMTPVFFERAGTEVTVRREMETRLQSSGSITIVEREMLDKLLQELNLGSSEVANADTQLQLGQVLAAQVFGFIEFSQTGPDIVMYLRLVNTETTSIESQLKYNLKDTKDISALVSTASDEVVKAITAKRKLQGLIADAAADDQIMLNIGPQHGVKVGQQFAIVVDGDPIVVGGKEIGRRQKKVGTLEVVSFKELSDVSSGGPQFAFCKVVEKSADLKLAADMKVREAVAKAQ